MNTENAFRRGFTLIELMIVIVILGILMGTILPRLTGAQARARDTARIGDLTQISQALEVYFSDTGAYPTIDAGSDGHCLDPNGANTDAALKLESYLKGGVPTNVQSQTRTDHSSADCTGFYYYSELTRNGTQAASYALMSDIETWQMANYNLTGGAPTPSDEPTDFTIGEAKDVIGSADLTEAKDSVFLLLPN